MRTKVGLMDGSIIKRGGFSESPCPHLPSVDQQLTADWTRVHHGKKDAAFYRATLEYGQSLWMEGKPAQAILQLNKAWSAELEGGESVLEQWALPYRALLWMMVRAPEDRFLGNPVRHFQHLATRVKGRDHERRSWRAWACFHLSMKVLPVEAFPIDSHQVEREGLVIPEMEEVLVALGQRGVAGERELFEEVMREADGLMNGPHGRG
jgi:hypothetical protein